jgi:hypothetical protein
MMDTLLKLCGAVFLIALGLRYGIIQGAMVWVADALYYGANLL